MQRHGCVEEEENNPMPCFLSIFLHISARLKPHGGYAMCSYRYLIIRAHRHPLLTHLSYFISISFLGYLALKSLPSREPRGEIPSNLDLFFTSVSAATVSSMSTVEMEVFSNPQLLVLAALMLIGGEVLASTVGLLFERQQLKQRLTTRTNPNYELSDPISDHVKCLVVLLAGYLLSVHILGSLSIMLYMSLVPSAGDVLRKKDIKVLTFAVFTAVSSFSNCGFIPTNENMVVFSSSTGLLLLIIPLSLVGNTLFPPALRLSLWAMKKLTRRREYGHLLERSMETGYHHLLPHLHSLLLAFTVLGLTAIQLVVICSMEWRSEAFVGMSSYQKVVGALFLAVNSRHAGESGVNLSSLSQAVLVLFVLLMYLPPYTAFMPVEEERRMVADEGKKGRGTAGRLVMSQLSCLAIFVILVCITERRELSTDPLNFSVLNIVVEVFSAYGNVGFSTGYSCERRVRAGGECKEAWYGFAGRWSSQGKLLLIFVMFFGRLKKFSLHCGQAWKLS